MEIQGNGQQIDQKILQASPSEKCNICGFDLWDYAMIFKKIPSIMSPSGNEELVQLQIAVCKKCLSPHGTPKVDKQKENKSTLTVEGG